MELSDLVNQGLASFKSGLADAAGQVSSALGLGQQAASTAEQAGTQTQQATTDLAVAQAKADTTKAADDAASAGTLGNLPGAKSKVLASLSDVSDQLADIQAKSLALNQKRSVGIFDDPGQWLVNRFDIPFEQKNLNAQEDSLSKRLQLVGQVQTLTSQATTENAAVDVVDANSKAAALTEAAAAQNMKELADNQFKLTTLGLQGAQLALTTNSDAYSSVLQYNNADMAVKNLNLQQAQFDSEQAYRTTETAKNNIMIQSRSDDVADKEAFEKQLVGSSALLGVNITTAAQFNRAPEAIKGSLLQVMSNQTVVPGAISLSPAKSLDILNTIGSVGASPGMADTINKLNTYKLNAGIAQDGKSPDPIFTSAKPEIRSALEDNAIRTSVSNEYKNIPVSGGIYSPAPLASVMKLSPLFDTFPLIQDMKPLAVNNQYPTNPNDFISAAIQSIKSGKSTPEAKANEIAAVFQGIARSNNEVHQYPRFAIPGMNTNTYNMTVSTSGRNKIVNMADPTALRTLLTRQIIDDQSKAVMQQENFDK